MVEKYDDNEPVEPNLTAMNILSPEDGEKSDR